IRPLETGHDVEILDPYLRPTLADTVEHRHDDNASAFFVQVHANVTVIGAGDRTDPRVWLVVPCVIFSLWLGVDFYEGLAPVKLSEYLKALCPGERLHRKTPADIHDAAYDRNVTGREVHAHALVGDAAEFLLHLIGVPVAYDVVEHYITANLWMMDSAR